MLVWSIHPSYLEVKNFVALWSESLLAQNVLLGNTKGWVNHPQLIRFRKHEFPLQAIANYLHDVCDEAENRGYNFKLEKIQLPWQKIDKLQITMAGIEHEWQYFLKKMKLRNLKYFNKWKNNIEIKTHPAFKIIEGKIKDWEYIKAFDKI